MKKVLIAVAAMLATVSMLAQGEVNFNNNTAPKTPWVDANGTTLLGDGYQVQLWVGTSEGSLSAIAAAPATFKMTGTPAAGTGIFLGGIVAVGVPYNTVLFYQAKVFPVGYNTYNAALAAGEKVGISKINSGLVVGPPSTPYVTLFDKVTLIPEPSTIALGVLGLGLLLLRRRS